MSLTEVKAIAKKRYEYLKKLGRDVKQSDIFEMMSWEAGFKDWNIYSAHLKEGNGGPRQAWKNSEIPKEISFLKNVEDGWRYVNHYKEYMKEIDEMTYNEYDNTPYVYVLSKLNYLPACELFKTYCSVLRSDNDVIVADIALHAAHICGSTGTDKVQTTDILDIAKSDPAKLFEYSKTMFIDLTRPIEDEFNVFSELELISIDNKLGVWLPDITSYYPESFLLTFKNFTDQEATKCFLDYMDALSR